MTFNDFVHKHDLKNEASSNIKIQQILSSIDNNSFYLRDGPFSTDIGIVSFHPSKGTHWVCKINESYSHSYGCVPPQKLSKFNLKRNVNCLDSEHKIQGQTSKKDSYCASFCLFILYLTKVLCIDSESAVLNFY